MLIYGQRETLPIDPEQPARRNTAINAGFMMGGGSLVGVDAEFLVSKTVGLQAGIGISSFGVGLDWHFKPIINSSFISLQYLHQGFGENFYGSYIGPMYVFRAKKILQAGLGWGIVVGTGKDRNGNDVTFKVGEWTLLYHIGVFFPL
ncbi:hypothetical protein FACS1894201_01810 [Bacteroidia bacterium]|nr:hypothetical protein FACS1894201_01810 [Bacteroidia bacterium]